MSESNGLKKKTRNKKSSKKNNKQNKFRKILKISLIVLTFLILTLGVTAAGYAIAIIRSTEPIDVERVKTLSQGAIFYNSHNEKNDTWKTKEDRETLTSDKIPKHLKDAFVSIEDERFETHKGIDIKRIFGALLHDVKVIIKGKGGFHGASTLTQQLLKNTILSNEDSKIERKIKEVYLALQLEKELTKDEILTAYLNTIPLGGTVYGVEAASHRYFKKDAIDLNLIESAYIAGVTQAPGLYDAFNPANKDKADRYLNRTKTVLSKMAELGKISEDEKNQAISDIDNGKLVFTYEAPTSKLNYEDFNRAVADQVQKDLQEKLKYTEEEAKRLINQGGLHIYTTMDEGLQKEVQEIVNDRANLAVPGKDTTDENGILELQAAATIKDPKTGEVKALVGGRGNQPAMSLNRGYSVLKPIGSATKPLSVYAPAIDLKLMHPGTVIDDAPFTPEELRGIGSQIKNMSGNFSGYLTLDKALAVSNNVVASKVVNLIGAKNAIAYGERFGLIYNEKSKTSNTAISLGEFNNDYKDPDGATPYSLAGAYGVFANNGVLVESTLYREVKDSSGKVILKSEPKETQVISPETAYIIYDMMKGTGASQGIAKVKNIPTAGKTGTTTGNKNYWFGGLTPYYSAAVWIGYDKPKAMGSNSTSTAGKLFGKIMNVAHDGLENTEIPKPQGVVTISTCMDSGMNPTGLCSRDPRGSRVQSHLAIAGTAPKESCSVHVTAEVNKINGKLANDKTPAGLRESRVFIKKEHYNSATADSKYALPREQDDLSGMPTTPDVAPPTGDGNGEEVIPPTDGNEGTPPPVLPPTTPPVQPPKPPTTPPAEIPPAAA